MKKILLIFSMLSLNSNFLLIIDTNTYHQNLSQNKNLLNTRANGEDFKDFDLSKLNTEINNLPKNWVPKEIISNNININYNDVLKNVHDYIHPKIGVLFTFAHAIDKKYNPLEEKYFNKNWIFETQVLDYQPINLKIFFTILAKNNSDEILNNNKNIFHTFNVDPNNIASFYIRISNNSSMNWKTNKSYVDFTINVCNFGSGNFIDSDSILNLKHNLDNVDKNDDWHNQNSGMTHNIESNIDIKLTDICPQFTNLKIASYFLDYSSFFINPNTWLHTYNYGNYDINSHHNNSAANQLYYFNLDTLTQDWAEEDPHFTNQHHEYSAKSKQPNTQLSKTSDRFHYFYCRFKYSHSSCYVTTYTHIWNKHYDPNSKENTLNNSNSFSISIVTTSTLVGSSKSWDLGCYIINANLKFYINTNIYDNIN